MRLVAATTDEEMLKVIIGSQILLGVMDYRGFSNMKGFQQFRAACRNGDERYDDLSYGFVEQTERIYYCFGCHKGGGAINFIMEIESLSYPDAVRFLAKRAGLEVPEDEQYQSQYQKQERRQRRPVLSLCP